MLVSVLWALLLTGGRSDDQAPQVQPTPALPVHVGGRAIHTGDGSLTFGWPGTYFESRFRGTGVDVAVESRSEFMRLLVDGEERILLQAPGNTRVSLRDLPPGEHVVRLEKQTESQTGGGHFIGFYPAAGTVPLPARPRSRQIEFIGDSYTAGYGNTSSGRECTPREVHDRTDTQRAFGPLLARKLDADYRVIAYSGFGIVRNYNGSSPGQSLPSLYDRLVPGDAGHREVSRGEWRPQLIVVNLGTNDFSTPLRAGEAWRDPQQLRTAYRQAYAAFARRLGRQQPQAQLVLMAPDSFFGDVSEVAATLKRSGRNKVMALRFGALDLTGCDFHPSLKDHQDLAALLQAALDGQGWWPGGRKE